ncbi:hypothetical protein E4Z66_16145 [Aliishimia ponticola]|uniref:Uncharacterized protein n=1 Tax=Aliishimia ponticola TaxID=2499833 RepID=A0A4S4N829_9RHOB|nr:hypothetical protein [Aliishimia ponticola]THH35346.1 hypothetical protein E4Z66_16145 [Aliishimia ponticola]
MLQANIENAKELDEMRQFVLSEREKCLSRREWKHRLLGFGYAVTETRTGQLITRLSTKETICLMNVTAVA